MPALGDVFTETIPVTLDANESSPYKPPHRPSSEKFPSQTLGNTESGIWHLNGKITENNLVDKVLSRVEGRTSNSLHSMPNGRSSESSEGQHRPGSKNESNFSISSGLGSAENVQQPSGHINGLPKNEMKDQTQEMAQINRIATQPLRKQTLENNPPLSSPRSPSRPHSASVPTTRHRRSASEHTSQGSSYQPSPNADPLKCDASSQAANRFSLPPVYPAPAAPAPGLSPTNSLTTPQHPGLTQLRHRHTLQVPKVSMNRGSRDFSFQNGNASEDAFSSSVASPTSGARRGSLSLVRRNTRSIHSDLYLEEVPQDGDVARWTETVRQKRASRRKRKEEEEDDRVMVGTKVDVNHVNWVTAYNMLTGIRFTVSRTNAKNDKELKDEDFDARHKFSFDITGNELTPSARYDFKFKDYAPWVFRRLRAKFKLDPADYLISLTSKYILSELGSPGKSGSFFYFSRDYKYIIKTIHHAEHKLLRKILRDYYNHVEKNPNTLISQFYGLHRVKIPYGRKIHFVVMNNLFPPHRDIHQIFDLKGSTVGRDLKEEDLEKDPKATRATLKDLNWLRRHKHLEFGPHKKRIFIDQMKRDVALLQNLKIMDYSLLVGIHDLGRGNEENLRDKTLQVFQPGVEHAEEAGANSLIRTPSKLENARKARELRHIIQRERPVPMDRSTSKMPEEMLEEKRDFFFYSDDGGFRATHENGQPGEEIYYLGIIDCLTHVSHTSLLLISRTNRTPSMEL